MIDYVIGGKKMRERVKRLEIGDQVDSDHQPIIVHVKGKKKRKGMRERESRKKRESMGLVGGKNKKIQRRNRRSTAEKRG